jgi:hypothetical protein
MTEMECSICITQFNKRDNKPVECPKCLKNVCVNCIKKYLTQTVYDAHCMHCKNIWDIYFLSKHLPHSFITKEYKENRTNILFSREQSFFPKTMKIIEQEKQKEEYQKQIFELEFQIQQLKYKINNIGKIKSKDEKNGFKIRQCPTANCKGFLNDKGSCPLCNLEFCLKCNVQKHENECKKEDLDTWKMICDSSKPCPNCATRISKTGGCAQMWCPSCHKAFNWNTGKIEKGPIHNPHYYEYSSRLGIDLAQIQQQPNMMCNNLWYLYQYSFLNIHSSYKKFCKIHQRLNHIVHNNLPYSRRKAEQDNEDLRLLYLKNKLDEDTFKKNLIKREKSRMKYERISSIYESIRDLSMLYLQKLKNQEINLDIFLKHIKNIENFSNETLTEINKTFKSNISSIIIN